ncbi:PRC-barrel domain-containing protein [Arthrobacter sp. efr-133-R2A-63]|uniref:PRC-barrel domain-containing protein n=1 Tax=Arthrobacter sp. efr-133-R2A-63 TaxID=3040278 RepID=UPI00254D9AD6|nr:PRC-barrel domain-containing protein [Arthrobacter sp. efr-133-R2A-63]
MIAKEHLDALLRGNGNVLSPDGEKIGGIGRFYLDGDTGEPSWITVKTGLFGLRESFVPLEGAWVQGDDLIVQHGKDEVKDAPLIDPEAHPGPEDEARLYQHYRPAEGLRTYAEAADGGDDGDFVRPAARPAAGPGAGRPTLHRYIGMDKDGPDESLAEEMRLENSDREEGSGPGPR